jgi:1-acyl-sn-glycerol-3-phosphate acyltransferase
MNIIKKIKSGWIFFGSVMATTLCGPFIALFGLLGMANLSFNICKIWGWIAIKIAFSKVKSYGLENIKKNQSYIIIVNHQSLYDIPALMLGLKMQFRWVIKEELRKIPLFGYALFASGHVFINRSNLRSSIKGMIKYMSSLQKGVSVAVFAEGTRSPSGELGEFKKGGFLMAINKGIPILPVTINGSNKVIPYKNSMCFSPGTIEVIAGPAIETKNYSSKNIDELMDKTRKAVLANLKIDIV